MIDVPARRMLARSRLRLVGSMVAAFAQLVPATARATPSPKHPATPSSTEAGQSPRDARWHAEEGRELFLLGRFAGAAAHYEQAYRLRPLPRLLYNLAQCYARMAGRENLQHAAHLFEAFLRSSSDDPPSDDPLREAVTKRLAEIRRQLATPQRMTALTRPGEPHAPAPAPAPWYRRWWFWTAVGGACAIVAAAVLATSFGGDGRVPQGPEVVLSEHALQRAW